jgi:uncharacterized cofD-like protein
VLGETRISRSRLRIRSIRLCPRDCQPLPDTLDAIARADLISFGPGSLFTSVIPNLLVEGIPAAIRASPALKSYFVNLMWQPGETTGFLASHHVQAIHRHAGMKLVDVVVVNNRPIGPRQRRKYAQERAQPVENDLAALEQMGVEVFGAELLGRGEIVRHDPAATAEVAMELALRGRRRRAAANRRAAGD